MIAITNRSKKYSIISVVIILAIIVGYRYYTLYFSNTGIFTNVTQRDGYALTLQQEQVPIEVFIDPEWIPFQEDERKELNMKLLEVHDTTLYLTDVWNRGQDIYFSFHAEHHMDYKRGEFLYNGVFNEDGTFTSPSVGGITLYDKENNPLAIGQTGYGPDADFSFGISIQDQELIKNGFYVKYTGYILYDYSKK